MAWRTPPLDWSKGQAVTSRAFYEIAAHPDIVNIVVALLGEDVMLWGASLQNRAAGVAHPWHSDIESCHPDGRTVSVWISIEHTNSDSALLIIPHSHALGVSIQEIRHQLGIERGKTTGDDVLGWAQAPQCRSELLAPEMAPGEALFFDGRLWHGSRNFSPRTRRALLLQYATPDTPIRIPDFNHLDWPFRQLDQPRPACLMLSGSDKAGVNRIVPAPLSGEFGSKLQLGSRIHPINVPLPADATSGWKPYPILHGATADLQDLTVHASVLKHRECPHPPHRHIEEEILMVLAGEVDLILPDIADATGNVRRRLTPGQFVYYPSNFAHTLETVSMEPANYLMFKWRTDSAESVAPLGFGQFTAFDPTQQSSVEGFHVRRIFQGQTQHLRKLECHASTMAPGASYAAHVDAYDVAIVVLEGEVETLGQRVGAHGVIFYAAGESHGMSNPGQTTARYVVFEFHGSRSTLPNALVKQPSLLAKAADPNAGERKLRHLL